MQSLQQPDFHHLAGFARIQRVWSLAWPTVVTMTSYTLMQFVDSLMVSQIGGLELAAQGNGGVWAWTMMAFLAGVITIVNTFVSQCVGRGDLRHAAGYAWCGVWLSVISWCLLLLPVAVWGLPLAFESMGHERALIDLEISYGRILLLGAVVNLAGKAISNFFFGIGRPKVITLSAILGNVANVIGNYVLIYGETGLPALGLPGVPGVTPMGVQGAAIATVIGTAIESAIPLCVFLGPQIARQYGSRRSWRIDIPGLRDLIRVGWPGSVQQGNEMVCWSVFMTVLVGRFGTEHLAAGWIVLRYMQLSFMPAVGFSVATTTLVGQFIGAREPELAAKAAHTSLWMAVVYMSLWGALMTIFREPMLRVFLAKGDGSGDVEHIVAIGSSVMMLAAVFQAFDGIGIVYLGALRGAGDTLWPGLVTAALSWALIVGGGWMCAVAFPQWGSWGPWAGTTIYIIALGGALAWRFEQGAWRSIRLPMTARDVPADAAGEHGGSL
jgi:MATE family multidrug resistance protein